MMNKRKPSDLFVHGELVLYWKTMKEFGEGVKG